MLPDFAHAKPNLKVVEQAWVSVGRFRLSKPLCNILLQIHTLKYF